jgi:septal ring factor EnvC (AmiA/AmiB activator)
MKTVLSLILLISLFIPAGAQTTEFLTNKDFQTEKKKLNEGINAAKKTGLETKKNLAKQNQTIDSLTQLIKDYQVQLAESNDSISSMNVTVNNLQNKVDQKKTSLRNQLIFVFGFIILLVVILFVWIFMIKKKSDQNFISLSDAAEKTNNKIDDGTIKFGEEIKGNRELIKATSDDLNQQLKSGLGQFEIRAGHIEQQIKDYTGIIEGKINKTKEENELLVKTQADKLNTLQTLVENKNQELTALISSLEKNQKGISPGIMDGLNALKTQLEQKIQTISDEVSKSRMK